MKNSYKQINKALSVQPLTGMPAFVSRMFNRVAVWPLILTVCLVLGGGKVWGQVTLFSENFGTSRGTSYTTVAGAIGTDVNWIMSRSGADWGARIDGGILDLTSDASATANVNGWVFGYRDINSLSGWNTTLSSNTGTITWEFNMRQIRTDPAGFSAGAYGAAFVLAGTSATAATAGSGYAVVLGQSGSTDAIRLAHFNNGIQGALTNIITSNTTGLTDFGAEYLSIRVTYIPSNNTWELFLRNDGTAFTDPTGGTVLTSQGTAVNNTYTSTAGMRYIGGYWQGSTGATQTAFFDNVYLKVTAATTAPAAPTITSITPGNSSLSVAFTAGADGGSAITNYKYSTDNGVSYTAVSPAATTSPIVITGLTNGTTYNVKIRAVNAVGDGAESTASSGTPRTIPSAPTITGITPGNQQLSVAFTAGSDGGSAITTYQYSTDGGTTWRTRASGTTASPLVISTLSTDGTTALTNGVSYDIQIRAVNAAGDGTASSTSSATPVAPTSPTLNPVTLAAALSSAYGTASAGVSFAVGGSNLTTTITATPQSGYEIATSSGGPYQSTAIADLTDGSTLWVRFASTLPAGNYNNQTVVVLSGGGASTDANVTTSLSGNTVSKATPIIISSPTASAITFGQSLASSTLSGGTASVAGSFAFTTPSTVPNGGTANQSVTFTPTDNANYNTTTTNISVTVNKANQTITFATLTNKSTADVPFALTGTASSGLAVSYTSSNTAVATVSGATVTIVGAGQTTITASQSGDANYNAAADVNQDLTVTSAPVNIFTENMGTPSATTNITSHTFQNSPTFTYTNGGAANPADVRISSPSSGYTGSSGNGNVFFTGTSGSYGFAIEGINASTYTNLEVRFAYRKESATALPNLTLDYWNGSSYVNVPFTFNEAATAAMGWYLVNWITLPAEAQISTLRLRWVKAGSTSVRLDDVTLRGLINTSPLILVSSASLTGFTQNASSPSSEQTYTVSGNNLTNAVTITPPTGYEISTTTGGSFSATNPITLSVSGGDIVGEPVTIYVRQSASTLGAVSGNITHTSNGANNPNVAVSGIRTGTYYSKSTGNLDDLSTWGQNTDGSGTSPANFTSAGFIYEIRNRATATIGANWTVSGAASKVVVGDGTNAVDFTIPSGFALTGTIDVSDNAELTIENATSPTLGTLALNSTLEYNNVAVTLSTSTTYRNLKLSGSGTKTFPGGTTTITGNLFFGNCTINGGSGPFSTISLAGNLTYTGTVTPPADANSITLSTNGTAAGTQTITGAGNTVRWFRIVTTTANTILLSTTGGASNLSLGNLSGGGITLVDGSVLNMNGNDMTLFNSTSTANAFVLNNTGTISTNSSTDFTIQRSGNGNLGTLRFTSGANTMGNLTLSHTGGLTTNSLTIGNALNVTGTITVAAGNLISNGTITLKSTATATASVATIGSGGSITGDVTVERYFGTNKTAWRLVTAPVAGSSNNSIFANWQNNGIATPGTGVEIWGPGGNVATNGLASGPLASMRGWDNDNGVFSNVTDSRTRALFSAANANPLGYFLVVTGPFGSGNIASGFAPTTVRATGALRQGNQTFSIPTPVADRYYMVANPYASPVNQGNGGTPGAPSYAITTSNTTNQMWMWDPSLSGLFGAGGYVSFDRLNNTYSVTEGSASGQTFTGGADYTRLQSGQAFFVRAASNPSGALTVAFTEASKGGSNSNGAFRVSNANTSEKMRVTLQRNFNGAYAVTDGAVAFFYNNANAAVDDMDGAKLSNAADNVMFRRNAAELTFEHRPLIQQTDTLYLNLSATTAATYRLVVEGSDFPAAINLGAWLQDTYLNTETQLQIAGSVNYDFNVDGNAASSGERFRIVFRTINSPLSVQFKALRATRSTNGIAVEWNTENEQELVDYSVERSADGRSFSSIGRVAARNNQQPELYRWNDAQPGSGDNFYRIKAQTQQGRSFYSGIARVRAANSSKGMSLYPNPMAKGQPLTLELRGMEKGTYRVTVFSPVGVQVLHRVLEHGGGDAAQTMLLPADLPAGTYVVDLTDAAGQRINYKLTIQ